MLIPPVIKLDTPRVDKPYDRWHERIQQKDVWLVYDKTTLPDDVSGDEEIHNQTDECSIDKQCHRLFLSKTYIEFGFIWDLFKINYQMVSLKIINVIHHYLSYNKFIKKYDCPSYWLGDDSCKDHRRWVLDPLSFLLLGFFIQLIPNLCKEPNQEEAKEHKCNADGPCLDPCFNFHVCWDVYELPVHVVRLRRLFTIEFVPLEDDFIWLRVNSLPFLIVSSYPLNRSEGILF